MNWHAPWWLFLECACKKRVEPHAERSTDLEGKVAVVTGRASGIGDVSGLTTEVTKVEMRFGCTA